MWNRNIKSCPALAAKMSYNKMNGGEAWAGTGVLRNNPLLHFICWSFPVGPSPLNIHAGDYWNSPGTAVVAQNPCVLSRRVRPGLYGVLQACVLWLQNQLLCVGEKHWRHGNVPQFVCFSACAVMRGEILEKERLGCEVLGGASFQRVPGRGQISLSVPSKMTLRQ